MSHSSANSTRKVAKLYLIRTLMLLATSSKMIKTTYPNNKTCASTDGSVI
jgi:hypothetical protein